MTDAIKTVAELKDAFFDSINTGLSVIENDSLDAFVDAVEHYIDYCRDICDTPTVGASLRTLKSWHAEYAAASAAA